jgi:transcriptional regulator with XRE-family HTH domain
VEIDDSGSESLGTYILKARQALWLSQSDLAARSSLTQAQISYFELGRRRPTLDQLLRIARALDLPIQRLLSGSDRPGEGLADIAIELRRLGIEDLWVQGAVVPGAFRRPEEVIALALSAPEPDPRVIEAIPAVLAWNDIDPTLLRAYGSVSGTTARIAWLADIALSIEREGGFPGGCRSGPLDRFLKSLETVRKRMALRTWDDLGKPTSGPPSSPIWKRWHIKYDASLGEFAGRARQLDQLRVGTRRQRRAQLLVTAVRARRKKAGAAQEGQAPIDVPKTTAAGVRKPGKGDGPGRP